MALVFNKIAFDHIVAMKYIKDKSKLQRNHYEKVLCYAIKLWLTSPGFIFLQVKYFIDKISQMELEVFVWRSTDDTCDEFSDDFIWLK